MADRNIHVMLTADTTQYVQAMKQARRATRAASTRSWSIYVAALLFTCGAVTGAAITALTLH